MKKILWFFLTLLDNNWGYATPLQKRFKVGNRAKISPFVLVDLRVGEIVTILEIGRHDYLITNGKVKKVVYQFELEKLR